MLFRKTGTVVALGSIALAASLTAGSLSGCATGRKQGANSDLSKPPAPAEVLATLERVADWQLAHPSRHASTDWTQGALYAGMMALDRVSPSPRFREAMRAIGEKNEWRLGPSWYNADDHCVGQMYAELAMREQDARMIEPMRQQFSAIIEKPSPFPTLDFSVYGAGDRWSWCDALFMAPPAWTRLATATGDRKFLDYAVTNWWITSDYLYDSEEHLFYRDSTYFNRLEANGRKVFWGRGNGWAMAGLARVLQDLPRTHADRSRFEQQFREMAGRILECQQPDGLWRSSLLDPESYPLKETSGSGFYTYALAWGVNEGLLERYRVEPAIYRAWQGLTGCVTSEGKLTHVQPIGADPKKFDTNLTEVYGVGAFLLAGSEVYRLAGGKVLHSLKPLAERIAPSRTPRNEDYLRVIERYRETIRHEPDRSLQEIPAADEPMLVRWIESCQTDGTWQDVDYANLDRAFWKAPEHLDRVRHLAWVLANPQHALANHAKLEEAVLRAIDHWLIKRYQSPNWWWNQIGVPGKMADIIVLLGDRLEGPRKAGALRVLGQAGKPRNGGGANTMWIADLALQHGALTQDPELMQLCQRVISNEIRIGGGEGIQSDFSFHQHGPRLQQFAYGRAYLVVAARLAWQLQETPWELSKEKVQMLADLALEGDQWMCRGVYTVPSTLDRSVSRPGTLRWGDIRPALGQVADLLPAEAAKLNAFLDRQNGSGKPLEGARVFPRSDFAVYHTRAFSWFLKLVSNRTRGSETGLNSEHLFGKLQNFGDHYLLRDGLEYFDLAPVWDWQLLPGVTVSSPELHPDPQAFTGALTDGASLAAVMDYRFTGSNQVALSARKFWVCHDQVIIGLIADLKSSGPEPVRTSLEQCLLRGRVEVSDGTEMRVLGDNAQASGFIQARHAGVTYVPIGGKLSVQTGTRSGAWKAVNASLSPEPVEKPVLQITLEHGGAGQTGSGGYVILPNSAGSEGLRESWQVLENSAVCQAVVFKDGTFALAFHQPGKLAVNGRIVEVDQPCLILQGKERTWVCDPSQRGIVVTLQVGERKRSLHLPKDGSACIL